MRYDFNFLQADKNWIFLYAFINWNCAFLCHLFMKGFVRRKSLSRRKSEINTQFLVPPLAIFFVRTLHIKDIFELVIPKHFPIFFFLLHYYIFAFLEVLNDDLKVFLICSHTFFSASRNIEQCSKVRKDKRFPSNNRPCYSWGTRCCHLMNVIMSKVLLNASSFIHWVRSRTHSRSSFSSHVATRISFHLRTDDNYWRWW